MTGNADPTMLAFLFERDSGRCFWCHTGVELPAPFSYPRTWHASRDHIILRREGGSDEADNLVLACYRCNVQRQDLSAERWLVITRKRREKRERFNILPEKRT